MGRAPTSTWTTSFLSVFPLLSSFNLLSFADDLQLWRDTLVKTTEAACHEAMQWVTHLSAEGSTSVLEALLASFTHECGQVAKQKHWHLPQ